MAYTILATAVLIAVCVWCARSLARLKQERACKHNFQHASSDHDVSFGTTTKYVCLNCGRVVTT
jgi:hypothetical protein